MLRPKQSLWAGERSAMVAGPSRSGAKGNRPIGLTSLRPRRSLHLQRGTQHRRSVAGRATLPLEKIDHPIRLDPATLTAHCHPPEALTRNQPLLLARTRPLAEHETRSLARATTTADESRPQELRPLGCALLAQPRARSRGGLGVQPPGSGLLLVSIPLSFLASASDNVR